MIKRFNIVKLKSVANVKYLSGPAGRPASPQGNWTVVVGVGEDKLLLAKDETIIVIPKEDVLVVADYNVQDTIKMIQTVKSKADLKKIKGDIYGKEGDGGSDNKG